MFTFLKRLFGPKPAEDIDTELEISESWQTDFRKPSTTRFTEETGESYSTRMTHDGLVLSFAKKNVYAWTIDPLYRYRDFVLEGLIEFPVTLGGDSDRAGSMASGFLFRYLTEATFYSVLVSDRGMVRMDVVINGTPVPVLGWTETKTAHEGAKDASAPAGTDEATTTTDSSEETPSSNSGELMPYQKNGRVFSIRIIARATSFTIMVNDTWVAECIDDTIQAAGKIAFAGQNWGTDGSESVTLRGIAIDSDPMEVEAVYARWNQYLPIPAEAHIALARTLYAMGKYVPAILELKRAWKEREPGADDLVLLGQVYLAQRLIPEAEEQIRKAIALEATHENAIAELGGILYLHNRFGELESLLKGLTRESIERSSFLLNLEGHVHHWKGNHAESAESYLKAARLAGNQGLFPFHAGNEYSDCGNTEKAVAAWLDAAHIFLSSNEYDDLGHTVENLLKAARGDVRVMGIAGKYYYGIDREREAFSFLEEATQAETDDSAAWYLHGMILSSRGADESAIASFRKAAELESDYGLYHYRLAETLFNSGKDCERELERAIETGSDNGWVWNLAAIKALGEGNRDRAEECIEKARKLLPGELTVLVNFAEILRQKGRLDDALALFDQNDPDALKAAANLLVEDRRNEEAEDYYQRALKGRPFDAGILTDRAANCLELDLLNEADDLIGRAFDIERSPRIYKLIGYLSGRKGEYARAEVALLQGLAEFPDDPELLYELASMYNATGKRPKAIETVRRLRELDGSDRTLELEGEITDSATTRIDCASCDRHWRVPKDMPAQGSLRLTAEPPDDMPAGTCPSCQEHYCIGCAKETLGEDGRFRCKKCGQPLKLVNQGIIWLLNRWQREEAER